LHQVQKLFELLTAIIGLQEFATGCRHQRLFLTTSLAVDDIHPFEETAKVAPEFLLACLFHNRTIMNPKNTTNRFAFRPDSKRYLPLVKPSSSQEMVYEPLSKIRVNSRKGEVDGVSLLHTLRNVTPIGSSLLNSPRGRSPSKPLEGKTLQEAIESLPNDRIRLGFIELSYSMCK
jgi:hypothetical protein